MATMMSYYTEKCYHLVNEHKVSVHTIAAALTSSGPVVHSYGTCFLTL